MGTHITTKSAASYLGVSAQRIRTLCRNGTLSASKVGQTWVIDKHSLDKYGLKSAHTLAEDRVAKKDMTPTFSKPIALSFFSGAMGLDLGVENAGFEVRLACEVDKFCRQTIALNRPSTALLGDINNYSAKDILRAAGLTKSDDIDLIMGGPPCQAFSTAGKRKGFNDDRGNVFLKYLDLAIELRPKYIVIENVRGLLSCPMEHRPHHQRGSDFPDLSEDELRGGALNFVLRTLEKSGYAYSFNLYNSANFGTPQIRERVIIICTRDGKTPPYLTPTHSDDELDGLPSWRTLRSAIGRLKKHTHLNFPEKRLRYYRMLGPGENWRNLPTKHQKVAMGNSFYAGGGKTGFYRRLAWDRPSPTLVTHPAMPATDLGHPEEDRPLSIQEYKRIQEFPVKWELAGPLTEQYKQIGNAVPLSLGTAVGKLVLGLIKGEKFETTNGFQFSRYKRTSDAEWKADFEVIRRKKLENPPHQPSLDL